MRVRKSNQKGFLMLEMVIFIIVLAIIASIGVPKVLNKARELHTKQELATVGAIIQLYEVDNGHLPSSLSSIQSYFKDSGYRKDGWMEDYFYNKTLRYIGSNHGFYENF